LTELADKINQEVASGETRTLTDYVGAALGESASAAERRRRNNDFVAGTNGQHKKTKKGE